MPTSPVYSASRLTSGNFIFRDRIRLEPDKVVFVKKHLIGGEEHSIAYEQLASISINRGFLFADLLFETTGGSEPVYLNGMWNGTAERAKNDLEARRKAKGVSKEDTIVELLTEQNQLLRTIAQKLGS
jgi:hypothetical protein